LYNLPNRDCAAHASSGELRLEANGLQRYREEYIDAIVEARRDKAACYAKLLKETGDIVPPYEPSWARSNWQSYCVRLPEGSDQRKVMQFMLDAGIATRRGVMCAHLEKAYDTEPWDCSRRRSVCSCSIGSCRELVQSEEAFRQCILLPMFTQITEAEQERVVECLYEACR
jgi:dTDP-4-amino-4,6-dideoxygalactose transaminase